MCPCIVNNQPIWLCGYHKHDNEHQTIFDTNKQLEDSKHMAKAYDQAHPLHGVQLGNGDVKELWQAPKGRPGSHPGRVASWLHPPPDLRTIRFESTTQVLAKRMLSTTESHGAAPRLLSTFHTHDGEVMQRATWGRLEAKQGFCSWCKGFAC